VPDPRLVFAVALNYRPMPPRPASSRLRRRSSPGRSPTSSCPIFTGTPSGARNRRTPPRLVQPGETPVSRIEQVGEIGQHFMAPSA
jgi:hypothetical protein